MNQHLQELVERARNFETTPEHFELQRRSFAFGNANIENSDVTREVVERAAKELEVMPSASGGRKEK